MDVIMTIKPVFITMVLALIMGLFSGTVATVLTQSYLERYVDSLEQATWWKQQLSEEKPRPTPGSYEEALQIAHDELFASLVLFYNSGSSATLLPGSEIGAGVVVTSDGWVLSTASAIGTRAFVGGVEYAMTNTVRDALTDSVLIKLEANGLPVIAFADSETLMSGQEVFVARGIDTLFATTIADPSAWSLPGVAGSAETFSGFLTFNDELSLDGAPVVNLSGELVAVGDTPLSFIKNAMTTAVRSGVYTRASFGAQLIDLSFVHLPDTSNRGFTRGALVTSVSFSGPASIGGLRTSDIILRVQDQTLTRQTSFAEILANYEPGKRVSILVDRNGEQLTLEVELGTL